MHNRIWGYWRFYRSFAILSLATTAVAIVYLIIIKGDPIRPIVSIKLMTWLVSYLFITKVRTERLIFYYNLAYRPVCLWLVSFSLDALILLISLIITASFK